MFGDFSPHLRPRLTFMNENRILSYHFLAEVDWTLIKIAFLLHLGTVVCQAGQWAAAAFVSRATGAALIVTVKRFYCWQCLQDCRIPTLKDLGNVC